ncbi:MAG TPA: large-conductance mechanosensitive channel protein MscL [Candidatus Hydrogenedentes bacterium]|nr:large-conductance mechanosensitive channel protein MscL [Candidatus Hydrogenedentota bacterium]HPG68957.1 large-conductance mechanosensitive channel protein MscL [Candidatus Hydrogenedentota bacterium]
MSILSEFKAFALRGNVVDMAVGIITGAAFGKIVSSLVADVVMPPIGVLLGGMDFTSLAITIKQAVGDAPAVVIGYGKFIQTVVDFTIVALAMFVAVKTMNVMSKREQQAPTAPPEPSKEEILLAEIRDLLKEKA